MKIKLIDFGYKNAPMRKHYNDAGADVYSMTTIAMKPGAVVKLPLGFGIELPDGYAACVFPRSGYATNGIVYELPPIDSGYRGEIHAIVTNNSNVDYIIREGDRVGQLVVFPIVLADFVEDLGDEQRGTTGFGASGR